MLLGAQAWEAVGRPDAALDAYQRFLDHFPQSADSAALARFRRGDLLERIGRWEQARSELRTLAATHPSHPLGFAALIRIVEHHERVGEGELAAYEGRRALETVDQVIAAHRDAAVQVRARTARAELLLLIGEPHAAFDALADTWRNHAGAPGAAEAGLRAAEVAESRLGDEELAAGLCREIAERAADPELRRRAAAAGARLTRMRR
jgi:tetratricopeptide (TPR) repeat protein